MDENVFTVDEKGNITFTDGGRDHVLSAEDIQTLKKQAQEKLVISDALAKARKQVAEAKSDLERQIAEGNLTNAELMKQKMIEKWRKEIDALDKPRTELADKVDNGIISSFVAFMEAYKENRKRVRMILSHEDVMRLDEIAEKAHEGFEEFIKFLDSEGEQYEMLETTESEKADKSTMYAVVMTDSKGGEQVITLKDSEVEEKIKDLDFLSKLRDAERLTTYRVQAEDIAENVFDITTAKSKKEAIEKLATAVKINESESPKTDISEGEKASEDARRTVSDYNLTQSEHLMKYYEEGSHRINPRDIDFTATAQYGIDVRKLGEAECRSLLAGNLSPLMQGVRRKDGKIEKFNLKFHLGKDARGKAGIIIQPQLKKAVVPTAIMGVPLSDSQREMLLKAGKLEKTIEVSVNGRRQSVMPYIDKETNQLMLRNYNSINLPDKVEGREISDEEKMKLLQGETVRMSELIDNGGQKYVGYVAVNPLTGRLHTVKGADLQYEYQVAANNRGARTEDLKQDKDTVLKSGQTANDDLKEPQVRRPGIKR